MKNRYCRRTKLSEAEFLDIVVSFSNGKTASETYRYMAAEGRRVSRQTIEKKFLELGDYIYRKRILPVFFRLHERHPESSVEEIQKHFLEQLWEGMRGTLDYNAFRAQGHPIPGGDVLVEIVRGSAPLRADDDIVVGMLRFRWRRFNGFPRAKFKSHLGSAFHLACGIQFSHVRECFRLIDDLKDDPL
ncbi:MAG TPA: hypothetical protein VE907_04410 [Gammaproteobacteria bacterium]|nr:hypothetical protein [Gammaproteobacteria bacterium]